MGRSIAPWISLKAMVKLFRMLVRKLIGLWHSLTFLAQTLWYFLGLFLVEVILLLTWYHDLNFLLFSASKAKLVHNLALLLSNWSRFKQDRAIL